jgi:hypothetical protein
MFWVLGFGFVCIWLFGFVMFVFEFVTVLDLKPKSDPKVAKTG